MHVHGWKDTSICWEITCPISIRFISPVGTPEFVYQRYKDDMLLEGYEDDNLISLRTFYRQWGEEFPKVVIPEVRNFKSLIM